MSVIERGLPKWPAMVVIGDPITIDQAAEIVVRTDPWSLSTNDDKFVAEICGALDIVFEIANPWRVGYSGSMDEFRKSVGAIDLEYLSNRRIVSCYIGGPHGWCDWDGRIGCDSYNIGKWPSCEVVLADWKRIAETFPFLRLRCQLFNGEQCEYGIEPVIEYVVAEGRVRAIEPEAKLQPTNNDLDGVVDRVREIREGRLDERGCTIEQLMRAVEIARRKR